MAEAEFQFSHARPAESKVRIECDGVFRSSQCLGQSRLRLQLIGTHERFGGGVGRNQRGVRAGNFFHSGDEFAQRGGDGAVACEHLLRLIHLADGEEQGGVICFLRVGNRLTTFGIFSQRREQITGAIGRERVLQRGGFSST